MLEAIQAFEKLLQHRPFSFTAEDQQAFVDSFRATALWHVATCKEVAVLWKHFGIHPDSIRTETDLLRVPPILVTLFKEFNLCCVPESDIALTLGSSGTGGQRSLQHLNQQSLHFVKRLAYRIHEDLGICSDTAYNYICFTYDPNIAKDLGTAFTDELLTSFTGKQEVYYAIRPHPSTGEWFFDRELCQKKLWDFHESGLPVRILGFPAFLLDLMAHCRKLPVLGDRAWIQTGGGYKNQQNKDVGKTAFRDMVSSRLGVPLTQIRDLFGMVEHGIPYVDDASGNMRIPNYGRVFTRDPYTLEPLPDGEEGLLHFLCSYNSSYPASSLLSTDYGVVHPDPDGRGKILTILGRAGVQRAKGCAIAAQELLK